MGIEPTSEAWEALNKALKAIELAALSFPSDGHNWKLDGNQKRLRIATALCARSHRRLRIWWLGLAASRVIYVSFR